MNTPHSNPEVAALLSPKVEAKVAEIVSEQQHQDRIGKMAAAEPFPGPTRDVFALIPDIPVGPYRIRPFYDYDFEVLSSLKHPLHAMMVEAMGGKESSSLTFEPRGPQVWNLAFLMTRSPDVIDEIVGKGGWDAFRSAAKAEFSRLQIPALTEIVKVIAHQMRIYWSPTLGYGEKTGEGEQGSNP